MSLVPNRNSRTTSRLAVRPPSGVDMTLFLLLICTALCSGPAFAVVSAAAAKSSFQLLREAIWSANNNAWGGSFEQLPHTQVTIQITSDVYLYRWLPRLHPNATSLNVISNCSDAAGKPRKCVIYGRQKYGVFRTFKWIDWSSSMNCSLFVDNFVFTGINGSVFEDVFCRITVKRSVFRNSGAQGIPMGLGFKSGAAIRQSYNKGGEWVAFPPASFSNCLFRNLSSDQPFSGSAYSASGNNRVWFYDSIFQDCTSSTIDVADGYLALVRCKLGSLQEDPTITAVDSTLIMHNTEVKSSIYLGTFSGETYFGKPYIVFCNSTLSGVSLFNDPNRNGTVVFCKSTHDTVDGNKEAAWSIKNTCPAQCK